LYLPHSLYLTFLLSLFTAPQLTGQAFETEVPQEKIFAHLDKPVYRAGEPVFVALYLVNAVSHAPDSISGVIHLELRGPEDKIVLAHKIYPNNGHAAARHQLNHGIQMIHRSPISVIGGLPEAGGQTTSAPPPLSKRAARQLATEAELKSTLRLGFFPEGGDCIVGLPCRVAVVALDQNDDPIALEGFVGESAQVAVGFFKTNAQGIGSLRYTPSSTTPLQAYLKTKEAFQFDLPPAREKGAIISVMNEADSVRRSVEYFQHSINDRRPFLDYLLANNQLIPGIYAATVYNPDGEPVAERLFFSAPKTMPGEVA